MGLNIEELKKRKEEIEKRRQEFVSKEFYNIQDGENIVRILPRSLKYFTKEGDDDFAIQYFVHYNFFDVDGYRMIVCWKTIGKECPLCKEVENMQDKVRAGRCRAKERFMYNVLDLRDGKLKLMETGPQIYDEIFKYVLNKEWGDLFGVKNGRNITIERIPADKTGTGWAKYVVVPSPQVTDISDILPEGWDTEIDKLKDKMPFIFTEEEMMRLIECFRKGVSPALEEQVRNEEVTQERAVQLNKKEEVIELLSCFGLEYSPRDSKCKECKYREACRVKFLSL